MVKTTYPAQWKYINKWSMVAYGLFFWLPLHYSFYMGHLSWKRGHVPRIQYNDLKIQKFVGNSGLRSKYLTTPALEFYPDQFNRMHFKYIKTFLKKHRPV